MLLRTIGIAVAIIALTGCAAAIPNCDPDGTDCSRMSQLRLDDIVTVGTHNSYKQAIDPKLFAYLMTKAPNRAPALDYSHISLNDQFSDGARAIELDVAYDPKGGLFAHPLGPALAGTVLADG